MSEATLQAPQEAAPVAGITTPSRRTAVKRRIGDVIADLGFADQETIDKAVERGREKGLPLGQALIAAGVIDSRQLARALAERNGLDHVDLDVYKVDQGAANLIDAATARRYRTVPIAFLGGRALLVAIADPANMLALDDIAMATGYELRRAVASPEDIEALIGQLSRLGSAVQEEEEPEVEAPVLDLRESAAEAPVVKLVHSIIADAVQRGASDIHFEPRGSEMRVRLRVDGVVFDSTTVPRSQVAGLVSRVKVMAELDISERRLPQDGRIGLSVDGSHIDLRVATLPVVRGEAVVMRVLDKSRAITNLDRLGMDSGERAAFERAIKATSGAVLVTGPTGSGKTSTLYAALSEVNTPEKTLIPIEDPVEFELSGVKQVQVNQKAGLTFATGLRSMVRADPDVILVGEVRDADTAQMAIESALTGHLVLTTLHTNDAPMAPARLVEMGIEPFLVGSAVACVVAQRLVRRLCDCKDPVELTPEVLAENGFEGVDDPIAGFQPAGCVRCGQSGYRGRVGIYEVMPVTDELRRLMLAKASGDELRAQARSEGMRTLRESGLEKIRQGVSSMAEVLRVVGTTQA
ncbi:MAG TPA: ATPase, T2SS/T4P/T4SS family [Thermoleophilaceae bacterium]|nr:ATPase, T2SS/T4P/T4SS family [Thermoleophilaceae bacterium]